MKISHFSVYLDKLGNKLLHEEDVNIFFKDISDKERIREELASKYRKEFNCNVVIYFNYGGVREEKRKRPKEV